MDAASPTITQLAWKHCVNYLFLYQITPFLQRPSIWAAGGASYLGPARPSGERRAIALQQQEGDIRVSTGCMFISDSLWDKTGAAGKIHLCTGLNLYELHSAHSENGAALRAHLQYSNFKSFYVCRRTDNAMPQRKTLIGFEDTLSVIYCSVQMGHRFPWSACISATIPAMHNVN